MANIFDLKELIPQTKVSTKPYVHTYKKNYTDEEFAEKLANYEEVPRDEWNKISKDIHIRYKRADGTFMTGGFVINIYISTKEESKDNTMIRLKSSVGKNAKEWTINTKKVSQIWKSSNFKPRPNIETLSGSIQQTSTNLQDQIERLRIEMSHITTEQKRIIALIKKLHHINM
jgi:hypothetical protein